MSDHSSISAIADSKARVWFPLTMSTVVLAVAIAALFMTFSMQLSPCTGVAQAAQCSVGDDELFTNSVTFEDEINVGATPGPGAVGQILTSGGASAPATWSGGLIVKTSDEAITSDDTLTADAELTLPLLANKTYSFEMILLMSSPATPDFQFQFNIGGGAVMDGLYPSQPGGAQEWTFFVEGAARIISTGGSEDAYLLRGTVQMGVSDQSLTFLWAQNVLDAGTTTVHQGSYMAVRQLD